MRKLLSDQRQMSVVTLLVMVATFTVGIGVLLFVLDNRATAQRAVDSENELRQIIQARCEARLAYDARFVTKAKADAKTWQTFYDISNRTPIPPKTDPKILKLFREQQQAMLTAQLAAQKIVDEGVIGSCNVFDK